MSSKPTESAAQPLEEAPQLPAATSHAQQPGFVGSPRSQVQPPHHAPSDLLSLCIMACVVMQQEGVVWTALLSGMAPGARQLSRAMNETYCGMFVMVHYFHQ